MARWKVTIEFDLDENGKVGNCDPLTWPMFHGESALLHRVTQMFHKHCSNPTASIEEVKETHINEKGIVDFGDG